jgi:hypothetical protein
MLPQNVPYDVTFYFQYAKLHRRVRATCTAEAIRKAGHQVFNLGLQYVAVIATRSED